MLVLGVLGLALFSLGVVKATPTNITILDQSPMITYFPSRSGPDSQTWNVTYDGTPWSSFYPGAIANGSSSHRTYYIGATASFGFRGTAVYLMGSGAGYTVTLNGETIPSGGDDGMMASRSGMKDQWWDVVLKVTGLDGVVIESIIFTVEIGNPE
jgi:hypothetical protein